MGVSYSINFGGSWCSSHIRYDVIVPSLKVKVPKADCTFEFGTEIESLFNSLFVVSNTKNSFRESLFLSSNNTPETILEVEMGVNIFFVSSSIEGSFTFVIGAQGGHVSGIADIHYDIRFNVVNEVSEPFGAFIVVFVVGVLVGYYKMCSQIMYSGESSIQMSGSKPTLLQNSLLEMYSVKITGIR